MLNYQRVPTSAPASAIWFAQSQKHWVGLQTPIHPCWTAGPSRCPSLLVWMFLDVVWKYEMKPPSRLSQSTLSLGFSCCHLQFKGERQSKWYFLLDHEGIFETWRSSWFWSVVHLPSQAVRNARQSRLQMCWQLIVGISSISFQYHFIAFNHFINTYIYIYSIYIYMYIYICIYIYINTIVPQQCSFLPTQQMSPLWSFAGPRRASAVHGPVGILEQWLYLSPVIWYHLPLENHWKTIGKPLENHRKTIGKWRFTIWLWLT